MKEKFIKSTIILIIGGAITKFLGMFIRVIMTRMVGPTGIGLYMLINPTFSLFMTLSQLSMPAAISKLVSEERHNTKKIYTSNIPVILLFNLFLMFVILLSAKTLSTNFLHDSRCYLPIISIALVLPFDAMSNMLRGYFFGKQRMIPHVISHIFEQIVRLTLIILITPTLLSINIIYAVCGLVLVNLISELLSIFVLFFFLPKNIIFKKEDLRPNRNSIKDVLEISIPTTGGRLAGNIGYFLEPILLTSSLLLAGYHNNFIITEYGIISGYVLPLLLMPGFFTGAISSALLPVISKAYVNNQKQYVKKKIKQACALSLAIGLPVTIILMMYPEFFLNLFYNTNHGATYLRILAPFFLLYYIESPLSSTLQAINRSKNIMYDNLKGIISKSLAIYLLSLLKIGMYGLLVGIIANVVIVTTSHYLNIKKVLQ